MLHVQLSTVLFEIVNFIILLAVLSRFFFRPVRNVMRNRELAIASRLREADEQAQQAKLEREQLATRMQEAAGEAEAALTAARTQAAAERERLLAESRKEAASLLDEATERIAEQQQRALADAAAEVREAAVAVAGRLIRDAAGPAVHEALLERFSQRAGCDTGEIPATLHAMLSQEHRQITIELAYPASAETEQRLQALVDGQARAGAAPQLTFRVEPALLAGLRLYVGELVVDSSLAQALRDLSAATTGDEAEQR